ncbi:MULTISPECIES: copper resistance system multicopper oxidase [Marinobacter]|uniref:copper resistance system multicopper oxidase n=1 Tax=Marinobacter TaxID=2742 RepID=UPI001245CE46|nr:MULTISPECIES: copper resistance system multicopper oxidase [Marinobacter]MBL3557754.1 copper resistance system multicopper oxidase [Marinobacter sp. JB05H06]MBL3827023.1 copper resistance system multicopper oxidase [Marinobacter sp. MC3]MBL3895529.1 copper resistance system multicopper oxidase [Marinobacter sp. MW3]MCK2150966.1 copper resistance system multicopper oxidase [Marinobacter alexandrii]
MKTRLLTGLLSLLMPAMVMAGEYDLTVDRVKIDTGDFVKEGIGYNGASPGPVMRFKEGENVKINVTNNLDEMTSIHWHGLILPFDQDGVPGISFPGIKPGETFTYEFPIQQAGTYWFHSHSGFQEPDGAYGSIVIEPEGREPFRYDREYVVQLTDKHPHSGDRIMRNLKMMPDYYNREQQTVGEFFSDVSKNGLMNTVSDRMAWGGMRMMKADVEDIHGFTGLINGKGPSQNWTGIFEPGERIRLRFINSSAMTYFDIRIPGLDMTVVQADGNNVQPVSVDEFRIGVAETYDVIVRPKDEQAYTIFAESMGRSGYARATLAPEEGMEAAVPQLREPARLTMADMSGMAGMDHGSMAGMDHGDMNMSSSEGMGGMDHSSMEGMDHSNMKGMDHSNMEGMDHSGMSGMDHGSMAMGKKGGPSDPFYAKGSGLVPTAANGGKFLSYADLKAQDPLYELREPTREIELRLTGNMERYTWSINGVKYEDADPIRLKYGERVRFKFVNETMMTHPMHLHGMWSILDVGAGQWNPIKHTISVNPGTTVYMETEVDEPGQWAFHCHLSYHAAAGMFRKVIVEGGPESAQAKTDVLVEDGGEV